MKLRFAKGQRVPVRKPPSNRRVACAELALAKERNRYALFRDEVWEEQPTALERIEGFDAGLEAGIHEQRKRRAASWRRARWLLANLVERDRLVLTDAWNRSRMPADPDMLLGHIGHFLRDSRERLDKGERWFVFQISDRRVILLWEPVAAVKLPTCVAGPFDDYLEAVPSVEGR